MDSFDVGYVLWVCIVVVSIEVCLVSGWFRRFGKISIMSIKNFVGGYER